MRLTSRRVRPHGHGGDEAPPSSRRHRDIQEDSEGRRFVAAVSMPQAGVRADVLVSTRVFSEA